MIDPWIVNYSKLSRNFIAIFSYTRYYHSHHLFFRPFVLRKMLKCWMRRGGRGTRRRPNRILYSIRRGKEKNFMAFKLFSTADNIPLILGLFFGKLWPGRGMGDRGESEKFNMFEIFEDVVGIHIIGGWLLLLGCVKYVCGKVRNFRSVNIRLRGMILMWEVCSLWKVLCLCRMVVNVDWCYIAKASSAWKLRLNSLLIVNKKKKNDLMIIESNFLHH